MPGFFSPPRHLIFCNMGPDLTARKVPGRKIIPRRAMVVIWLLSFFERSAMRCDCFAFCRER